MDRLGHTTSTAAMRYQHVAAGRADALAERLSALAAPAVVGRRASGGYERPHLRNESETMVDNPTEPFAS